MIKYSNLGQHKQLNEIVMAGSHDAGVTEGGGNVQTQNMDIYLQAYAGVRLFDIRIAGQSAADQGLGKEAQLKAYHSAIKIKLDDDTPAHGSGQEDRRASATLVGGDWGMGLTHMLREAKKFVEQKPGRVPDPQVRQVQQLDSDRRDLHPVSRQLDVLRARQREHPDDRRTRRVRSSSCSDESGLRRCADLSADDGHPGLQEPGGEGASYDPLLFDGLQYLGKGGTSVAKPFFKIDAEQGKAVKAHEEGRRRQPGRHGHDVLDDYGHLREHQGAQRHDVDGEQAVRADQAVVQRSRGIGGVTSREEHRSGARLALAAC